MFLLTHNKSILKNINGGLNVNTNINKKKTIQPPDLEEDIKLCPEILDKVINRNEYAQNLYAAFCNMRWVPAKVIPILKEEYWSVSWRSAGGLIARLQQRGDYMDWYCSGMGGLNQEYDNKETDEDWQKRTGFVPEGIITDEIRADLRKIGWIPSPWPEDEA